MVVPAKAIYPVKLGMLQVDSEDANPVKDVVAKILKLDQADIEDRQIIITAIRGDYGKVSHFAISVNGSPTRGTIIVEKGGGVDSREFDLAIAIYRDEVKRLRVRGKSRKVVWEFLDKYSHLFD